MHSSFVNDARIMRDEGLLLCVYIHSITHLSSARVVLRIYIHARIVYFMTFSDVHTGPYSLNGVPLRRVNQKYVIATSTKVNLTAAVTAVTSKIDDAFFAREKAAKPTEEVNSFYYFYYYYCYYYYQSPTICIKSYIYMNKY